MKKNLTDYVIEKFLEEYKDASIVARYVPDEEKWVVEVDQVVTYECQVHGDSDEFAFVNVKNPDDVLAFELPEDLAYFE